MCSLALRYCNQRILKFDSTGTLLENWNTPIESLPLFVPHKLSLSADRGTLFVADRENDRVLSYNTNTGVGKVFSGQRTLHGSVYAISLNGSNNWPMYGVFGGNPGSVGFTLDSKGAQIATWGPKNVSGVMCLRYMYVQSTFLCGNTNNPLFECIIS